MGVRQERQRVMRVDHDEFRVSREIDYGNG